MAQADGGGMQPLPLREADNSWELIRDKVAEECFGLSVVPVPFLEDAASYDLLTVLVRKPQLGQSFLCRPRCLVPVGPLEDLLPGATAARELAHCTHEYNARPWDECRYEEMRLVDRALRHIRLNMAGVHKKVAFLVLRPGLVALRPDLPWLRGHTSLYVIYEVFYCSSLRLAVAQGGEQRSLQLQRPLPVAFSCLKFPLSSKGVLGSQKPVGHRLPAKAAWVRMVALKAPSPATCLQPPQPDEGASGRKHWRPLAMSSRTLAGKWPFQWRQPKRGLSAVSLADPERHSMARPLLQNTAAESDTYE